MYFYKVAILFISLMGLLPTYYCCHQFLSRRLFPSLSIYPKMNLGVSILLANTYFSLVTTFLVFIEKLNLYTTLVIILPGILYCILNPPKLRASNIFTIYRIIYLLICFIFLLACALPEYAWDAISYHLNPNYGGFSFSYKPDLYSALPKGLDVLFWYGQALTKQTSLSRFFHLSYLIALSLIFYDVIREYMSKQLGKWFTLFVLVLPYGCTWAIASYVDVGTACFEVLMCFSFLFWLKNQSKTWTRLILFSIGGALSIKYTPLLMITVFGIIALSSLMLNKQLRHFIKSIDLPSILLLILPCMFWYIKNLMVYHNPIWPFIFGHEGMTQAAYLQLTVDNLNFYKSPRTLFNFLFLFPRMLFYRLEQYHLSGMEIFSLKSLKGIDPTWLLSLVSILIAVIKRNNPVIIIGLIVYIFLGMTFWFGSHQYRYMLGTLYLHVFLIAAVFYFFRQYKKTTLTLFLVIFVGFAFKGGFFKMAKEVVTTSLYDQNLKVYYTSHIHDYNFIVMAQTNKINKEHITFCNSPLILKHPDVSFKPNPISTELYQDSHESIVQNLKQSKIRYFFIHKKNSKYLKSMLDRSQHLEEKILGEKKKCLSLEAYISSQAKLIDSDGMGFIYQL